MERRKRKTGSRLTESHNLKEEAVPNGLKAKTEIFILYFHNNVSKKFELKEFKTKAELIVFIQTYKISDPIAYKGVKIGNLE